MWIQPDQIQAMIGTLQLAPLATAYWSYVGNKYAVASTSDLTEAQLHLLTQHINPYGRFDLDMDARIPIEQAA